MEIVTVPVECYALIENEWWRVVGVAIENGYVAVTSPRGENKIMPPEKSFNWDLLWPQGIRVTI